MGDWRKSTYSDTNGGSDVEAASGNAVQGPGQPGHAGRTLSVIVGA